MKKEEFLKLLKERLIERGASADAAEKETQHVNTYLSESGMEELDVSIDEMADGIMAMMEDGAEQDVPAQEPPATFAVSEPETDSVSDELKAAIDAIEDGEAEDKAADVQQSAALPEPESEAQEPSPKEDDAKNNEVLPTANDEKPKTDIPEIIVETPPPVIFVPEEEEDGGPIDIERFAPHEKKEKMKNKITLKNTDNAWLYVTLLVITIPIAVSLILIAAAVYLGFWVALALAMIGCIALLVVFVAVGSIVSLVGIVYGVVELITGLMPVGLFEIGLGVIVGASVMFIGILIYNFAVRLIPFGMKLLAKLFKMGFNGLRKGYQMLKGAVANI